MKSLFKRTALNALMALFAFSVVLPLLWVLVSSVKPGAEILGKPWALPSAMHWENYAHAWSEAGIGHSFLNSLIVCVATMAILMPISAMAAYVLAKYVFPGSKALLATFLSGMMLPQFLVIVPLFIMMRDLHLLYTLYGLVIVYVAFSLSFSIFVLTGFFQTLPDELGEAAMLDGCGHARTFWRVMLPLARPGMIVVGIFDAIGLWNEYGLALVLLGPKNPTLPLGIANLTMTEQYQSDWGALFAGLVIVMIPVLLLYWFFRDKIHEAMLAGAVKG